MRLIKNQFLLDKPVVNIVSTYCQPSIFSELIWIMNDLKGMFFIPRNKREKRTVKKVRLLTKKYID